MKLTLDTVEPGLFREENIYDRIYLRVINGFLLHASSVRHCMLKTADPSLNLTEKHNIIIACGKTYVK